MIFYMKQDLIKDCEISLNEDKQLQISFTKNRIGKYYCSFDDGQNWQKAENSICTNNLSDQSYNITLKNGLKTQIVGNNDNIGTYDLIVDEEKIYLSSEDYYQLNIRLEKTGYFFDELILDYDHNIIEIDDNYIIHPKSAGSTVINISFKDINKEIEVVCTDLIKAIPEQFDFERPCLDGSSISKEENILLDEILESRINEAGYHTRAGALAAARFLCLEFAYRLNYFFENGRVNWGVDGQGRYYHKGLYLNEYKIEDLYYDSSNSGPWGYKLYSHSAEEIERNGLDCSGFVTWVLFNAGYHCGDISAYELCETGDNRWDIVSLIDSNQIKAGDLVHNNELNSHIGIIIGIDEDYYYVAQSIWYGDSGVIITPYTKNEFISHWRSVVLMDEYYESDGNYTAMWK